MPDVVRSFKKLFADDTNIFKAIESMNDISIIQENVNKLFEWSKEWQLPFSKLNPNSWKLLYKYLIRPILEYYSAVWYPLYKEIKEIRNQKSLIRINYISRVHRIVE